MHHVLNLIACVLPLAAARTALPFYTIPHSLMAAGPADCPLPVAFNITGLEVWTPAPGNNNTATLDFSFQDNSTNLSTACHMNATSSKVNQPGFSTRYACDNPIVEFIYQNTSLTMIEKACPGSSGTGFEASGTVDFTLICGQTKCESSTGNGTQCSSSGVSANFTSLEPIGE